MITQDGPIHEEVSSPIEDQPTSEYDHKAAIQKYYDILVECLDLETGLLRALVTNGVLSFRQMTSIKGNTNDDQKVEALLKMLLQKSRQMYDKFLESLAEKSQQHIVNMLQHRQATDPDIGGDLPLMMMLTRDQLESRIDRNLDCLVEMIIPQVVLGKLVAAGCITADHRKAIQTISTRAEMNEKLLAVLRRRSYHAYQDFWRILRETENPNMILVARLFEEGGKIVSVDAELELAENVAWNHQAIERELTVKLGEILTRLNSKQAIRAEDWNRLDELHCELDQKSITIFYLRPDHSIVFYIWCRTEAAVKYLLKISESGRLKIILTAFVNFASAMISGAEIVLNIREIQTDGPLKKDSRKLSSLGLPWEIVEMVLMKASIVMYSWLNKVTSRSQVDTYINLTSVCACWHAVITGRDWFKNTLRHHLKAICTPYSLSIKELARLETNRRGVLGVAFLLDRIFVVCEGLHNIIVFETNNAYRRSEIDGQEMEPRDIAACSQEVCVYVSDGWVGQCIWYFDLRFDDPKVTKWIDVPDRPWTVSVAAGGHVLVVTEAGTLEVYGPDKVKLNNIPIPADIKDPLHAIWTSAETYIICHVMYDGKHQITEITEDGRMLLSYGGLKGRGVGQLNVPSHLAGGLHGRVFVTDCDNNRVLLFDSKLNLERVVLTKEHENLDEPGRLCYVQISDGSSRLIIGMNGQVVVFRLQ